MNIFEAVSSGDIKRVTELLNEGVDVDSRYENGSTPLMFAAQNNKLNVVKFLIKRGADINARNNSKITSLMFAADNGSVDIVNLLLDKGVDINIKDDIGTSALLYAIFHSNTTSNLNTVKLLLDRGADINIKNDNGDTLLIVAVNHSNTTSNLDTVKLLLDRGADIDAKSNKGNTALILSLNRTSNLETLKLLLEHGANPFEINNSGKSAMDYSSGESKQLLSEYIWKWLYKTDTNLAEKYSRSTSLPKDIWRIILLNKRQQLLCQYISSQGNKEVLRFFALELGIPVTEQMTKGQLCGIISRQLAYEKYSEKAMREMKQFKDQILVIARKLNIDIDNPLENIMRDISKML